MAAVMPQPQALAEQAALEAPVVWEVLPMPEDWQGIALVY